MSCGASPDRIFAGGARGYRSSESFLDPKSSAAARRAIDRMMAGLDLLAAFPEIGVRTSERFRTFYVRFGKGAYVVRYRIEADAILITRIWHSRERRR